MAQNNDPDDVPEEMQPDLFGGPDVPASPERGTSPT
jgi:hypothetical protein